MNGGVWRQGNLKGGRSGHYRTRPKHAYEFYI